MPAEAPVAPAAPTAPVMPDSPQVRPSPFKASVKAAIQKHDITPKPAAAAPATPVAPAVAATPPVPDPATPTQSTAPQPELKPAQSQDDDIPESFLNAKAENWKRARQLISELKTKEKTLADQLKAKDDEIVKFKTKLQVDPEFQAKHEALQKERDTYATIVERHSISEDPRFQAAYDRPMQVALDTAKSVAGEKGEHLVSILTAPDSKWRTNAIKDLTEDMSPFDAGRLGAALQKYDEIRGERQARLDDSKEQVKKRREMDATNEAERQKQTTAVRESKYQEALKAAREFPSFRAIDGNAEHNAAVAANEAALKKFITQDGLTFEEYAQAPIQVAEAKRLKAELDTLIKERDELKKAVAEYQGATPGARGGGNVQRTTGAPTVKTPWGNSAFVGEALSRLKNGP